MTAQDTFDTPLSAFPMSQAVRNPTPSRACSEALSIAPIANAGVDDWQMMRRGTCTIGFLPGMLERNMLTFNPSWQGEERPSAEFEDIRAIQARLQAAGIAVDTPHNPASTGPTSLTARGPDGNPVVFDKHVPAPGR